MLALVVHHLFLLPERSETRGRSIKISMKPQEFLACICLFLSQATHCLLPHLHPPCIASIEGAKDQGCPLFLKADRAVGGLGLSNEQVQSHLRYSRYNCLYPRGSIASGYFIGMALEEGKFHPCHHIQLSLHRLLPSRYIRTDGCVWWT